MRKLAYGLVGVVFTSWISLVACGTDNGPNVYGEQYGPNSKVDARADDVTPVPGEPGEDAGESDAPVDVVQPPGCVGMETIAVLAGDDASMTGAVRGGSGTWIGGAIPGAAAKSVPALTAFGAGFLAVTRGPGDVLQGIAFGTTFGTPTAIGTATSLDAPSLAVIGTTAHVAYLSGGSAGVVNKFFHGTNTGSGWDAANDPVKPAAGAQSFGPSGPAIAGGGTDLVFANDGQDNGLYTQVLSAGAWSAASAVVGAGTHKPAPPAMVSTGGGTFDVVVFWVDKDTRRISFAPRNATTKTWGAAAVIDTLATTDEHLTVARVSSSTILVAFRGQDLKGYVATGTIGASSITWTAAVPVTPGGALVDSAPSIAKGICGDDAIAVFASSSQVRATTLRAGTWSAPETVTGASGSRVAVATR